MSKKKSLVKGAVCKIVAKTGTAIQNRPRRTPSLYLLLKQLDPATAAY